MFNAGFNFTSAAGNYQGTQNHNELRNEQIEAQRDENITDRGMDLDSEAFLKLLVTQMQYQDPFSGEQDTGEFMDQVAQLTMVERMIGMEQTLEDFAQQQTSSGALNLLNKEVEIEIDEGDNVKGEVTGIRFQDNNAFVKVDGEEYPLKDVVAVGDTVSSEQPEDVKE